METLKLGGREFRPLTVSTIEHDLWVMGQVRRAGLDRITMGGDETADDFARRLLDVILQSRQIFALLGGLLVPAEVPDLEWTPETAEATGAFLRTVTDPAEKQVLITEVAGLTASFFGSGLVSPTIFRPYSATPDPSSPTSGLPPAASGPDSSASSAGTTPADTPPPAAGLSGKRWWRIWPWSRNGH